MPPTPSTPRAADPASRRRPNAHPAERLADAPPDGQFGPRPERECDSVHGGIDVRHVEQRGREPGLRAGCGSSGGSSSQGNSLGSIRPTRVWHRWKKLARMISSRGACDDPELPGGLRPVAAAGFPLPASRCVRVYFAGPLDPDTEHRAWRRTPCRVIRLPPPECRSSTAWSGRLASAFTLTVDASASARTTRPSCRACGRRCRRAGSRGIRRWWITCSRSGSAAPTGRGARRSTCFMAASRCTRAPGSRRGSPRPGVAPAPVRRRDRVQPRLRPRRGGRLARSGHRAARRQPGRQEHAGGGAAPRRRFLLLRRVRGTRSRRHALALRAAAIDSILRGIERGRPAL